MEIDSPSFGGAAVADIDNDGRLEVAFGTYFGDDSVRVLNGEDGSELWRYNAGKENDFNSISASHGVTIADLTGDNQLDVFFVIGRTQPEKTGLPICLAGFSGTGEVGICCATTPKAPAI